MGITEHGTRVDDNALIRERIEDDYQFPWIVGEQTDEGETIIQDTEGNIVAICEGVFIASRIAAAVNATSRFGTGELREKKLVGNLLARIVVLQRILDETLYTKNSDGEEVCRMCGASKTQRHAATRLCHCLNRR